MKFRKKLRNVALNIAEGGSSCNPSVLFGYFPPQETEDTLREYISLGSKLVEAYDSVREEFSPKKIALNLDTFPVRSIGDGRSIEFSLNGSICLHSHPTRERGKGNGYTVEIMAAHNFFGDFNKTRLLDATRKFIEGAGIPQFAHRGANWQILSEILVPKGYDVQRTLRKSFYSIIPYYGKDKN